MCPKNFKSFHTFFAEKRRVECKKLMLEKPVRDGSAIGQDFPFGFLGPGNLVSNFRNTVKIFFSVRN